MIEIIQIAVLNDNYIYILRNGNEAAVVDPALAEPVLKWLKDNNCELKYILNTHHHFDHIGGNIELKQKTGAVVCGFANDAARIAGIEKYLEDGEQINILGSKAQVIFVPGHTMGHIAYYFCDEKALFCGDTIFSLGCGRLFEGTYQQMFDSLVKLKKLPDDTLIYCAHEYTLSNGNFAVTIEPDNKDLRCRVDEVKILRSDGKPTIPVKMKDEKLTNPFLRASGVNEFSRIRKAKDGF